MVVHDDPISLDDFFTPQRIAEFEQISTEIKAGGKTFTMDEVREHFENKRLAWLERSWPTKR